MATAQPETDTGNRILDIAERLAQTRGFNAFSYADIAAALGVTKASLHYHFPSKAKLGERLVERYQAAFVDRLAHIERSHADPRARLAAYVGVYREVLENGRMCLCGMLAADQETLPEPMRARVREFFDLNEAWLAALLQQGRKSGRILFSGPPAARARLLIGALEGAMLLARSHQDPGRFHAAAKCLMADLGAGGRRPGSGARAAAAAPKLSR